MKRRDFLSWVGVGGLATSLPIVLAACDAGGPTADSGGAPTADSGNPPDSAATTNSTAEVNSFVPVGSLSTLEEQGFIADKDFSEGPVLVIRNPENSAALIAVNATCPHQGCAVDWQPEDNQFLCPCHRSAFQPDGSLISGPATQDLALLEVKAEDGQVLVRAS